MTAHWFCCRTKPNAETKAMKHLQQQNFECYLPVYRKRRKRIITAPLFPRYLFVSFDPSVQQWRSINSTIGVSRLICNGTDPTPMPSNIIAELRSRENSDGYIEMGAPLIPPGTEVRILGGEFEEFLGCFERMTDHERVVILLNVLGRKTRVQLPADMIVAQPKRTLAARTRTGGSLSR
jgi:transcriptional antiterminator RfaH